jgi:hypothetical protein
VPLKSFRRILGALCRRQPSTHRTSGFNFSAKVDLDGPLQVDAASTPLRLAKSLFDREGPGSGPSLQQAEAVDL